MTLSGHLVCPYCVHYVLKAPYVKHWDSDGHTRCCVCRWTQPDEGMVFSFKPHTEEILFRGEFKLRCTFEHSPIRAYLVTNDKGAVIQ